MEQVAGCRRLGPPCGMDWRRREGVTVARRRDDMGQSPSVNHVRGACRRLRGLRTASAPLLHMYDASAVLSRRDPQTQLPPIIHRPPCCQAECPGGPAIRPWLLPHYATVPDKRAGRAQAPRKLLCERETFELLPSAAEAQPNNTRLLALSNLVHSALPGQAVTLPQMEC